MYVWRDAGALHWSHRFPFLTLAALTLVSAAAYGTASWYGLERPCFANRRRVPPARETDDRESGRSLRRGPLGSRERITCCATSRSSA